MVTQGRIPRNAEVRVLRDGQVIWQGRIASLKRFKEDVREVAQGYECGIGLDGFDDFREGDVIGPSRWWRSPPKAMLRLLALLALCLYGAERLPEAPKGAEGLFAPGPILAKQEERSPLLPAPPVPEARRGFRRSPGLRPSGRRPGRASPRPKSFSSSSPGCSWKGVRRLSPRNVLRQRRQKALGTTARDAHPRGSA